MNVLEHGAIGALAGAAVGDALGGATEGRSPEQIQSALRRPGHRHRRPVRRRLAHRPAAVARTTRATATSPTTP